MEFTLYLLGIVIIFVLGVIVFFKYKLTYWYNIGLCILKPKIPWGDAKELYLKQLSIGNQMHSYYKQFKAKGVKHGGIYISAKPFYMPVDPELIQNIVQKDFQYFINHGEYIDESQYPLCGQLFNMRDGKWKNMRTELVAAFTSGRMKMMFETLTDCAQNLKTVLDRYAMSNTAVEIKEILSCFTTDFITYVGLGVECNSLDNPKSPFRKYGKKVFEYKFWDEFKALLQSGLPYSVFSLSRFRVTNRDVENFFIKTVEDILTYREKNNVCKQDFMDLLLQMKKRKSKTYDLAAQAFVFFEAGFETSSITMTFALYELAANRDIQKRLRDEVNSVLSMQNDRLTYHSVKAMTYLDKVVCETLRKYPPIPFLQRECSRSYNIPQSNVHLEKGTNVIISISGIHNDADYYPDPNVFDPERFSEENKVARPSITYLPFGEGPRMCIGMRLALLQIKVGLALLTKHYRVSINKKTAIPIRFDKRNFLTAAEGGIWLNLEKLS